MDEDLSTPATTTLWDAAEGRWWPVVPLLYAAGGVTLTALLGVLTRLDPWSLLALLFVPYGLHAAAAARTRVRLTPTGVEVRGLRTRLLPYAEVASVEVAPPWDGAQAVWLRLRSSPPSAEPEVLTPPPGWTRTSGRSLDDVVDLVRARVEVS